MQKRWKRVQMKEQTTVSVPDENQRSRRFLMMDKQEGSDMEGLEQQDSAIGKVDRMGEQESSIREARVVEDIMET